ncbi:DlpA domain-containing protein [Phlyctema vagabunda]|uniref:DlpA domain-containing protein n=1 Tax=Phlyctema vagabunda TaxID=108571 RepID=A0ABR4PJX5_9HELO
MTAVPTTQLQALKEYTACDIADALLKLKVPGSGYLPDLSIYPAHAVAEKEEIVIAPASTVLFVPKNASDTSRYGSANIPSGKHWVDLTKPGTIVVLSQPEGQKNAVLGGIMALRMKVLGAHGVIVSGRVRDMVELEATGLPVWARGSSAVGAGAESSPYAIEVPLVIDGTEVSPGDLVFSDRTNGVIVIPKDKVDAVVEMLPKIVGADDRVKEEVQNGITVQEAFKKHRG